MSGLEKHYLNYRRHTFIMRLCLYIYQIIKNVTFQAFINFKKVFRKKKSIKKIKN